MIFFYFFILLPLHVYSGDELSPSYRSSVMEGDKPILRGGGPEPEPELETVEKSAAPDNARSKITQGQEHDPEMVKHFSLFLGWLIDNYGYEIAQSRRQGEETIDEEFFIRSRGKRKNKKQKQRKSKKKKKHGHKKNKRRSKRDTRLQERRAAGRRHSYGHKLRKYLKSGQRKRDAMYSRRNTVIRRQGNDTVLEKPNTKQGDNSGLDQVQTVPGQVVNKDPKQNILAVPMKRSIPPDDLSDTHEPGWKIGLKDFMKDLISRVSRTRLDRYARPVIRAIERDNKISIADLDVDKNGHIFVDYVDMTKPKSKVIVDKGKWGMEPGSVHEDRTVKRKSKSRNKKKHANTKSSGYTSGSGFDEWKPES